MFYFGWMGYKDMSNIPDDAMVVNITAQMWKWTFKYDNGRISDTLYVPVNRAVKVIQNSLDVNHSFYIPAFRVKKDVIPGKVNTSWFRATEVGSYSIFCAEYCGLNHSYMYTEVVVLPQNNFNTWLATGVRQINNFTNQK